MPACPIFSRHAGRSRFNGPLSALASRSALLLAFALAVSSCQEATQGTDAVDPQLIAANDRGVALMGRYQYADAEEIFADVAAHAPAWLDARVNLAIATLNRQQEGDERLALDILATVLAEDPGHLRALYATAILNLYLGDAEPAAQLLRKVVEADPKDAYAAYFLGQSLLQQGDYAGAAEWMVKSAEMDPYLRSAYWAGSQALRRVGKTEEATQLLADYQRFDAHPAARLAGFSYARMGPKAKALATTPLATKPLATPAESGNGADRIDGADQINSADQIDGTDQLSDALFAERQALSTTLANIVTTADLDADGWQDLVASGAATTVFTGSANGFAEVAEHPLATIVDGAPLWGDVDDDGLLDVVVCGGNGVRYWRQVATAEATTWQQETALDETPCTAGALFDADHDGDLDVFVTGEIGNELFNNNRDGSFRRLAAEYGLAGSAGRQVLTADLDGDRDMDIIVLNHAPPHDVWQNDRTWRYQPLPGLDDFRAADLVAATVVDADADGHRELYGLAQDGSLLRWRYDGAIWHRDSLAAPAFGAGSVGRQLDATDFDGDGSPELLLVADGGLAIFDPRTGETVFEQALAGLTSALPVSLAAAEGPRLVATAADGMWLWPAGPGRHRFLTILPMGRSDADQMRSNASGIGTLVKVRFAGRWSIFDAVDANSGPGQSLQPLSAGLGAHGQADFVALEWSDGVSQTELDLAAGERHVIAETQRQLASCPVVFAWDGQAFRFVSDVLGGAALGYLAAPETYSSPRPVESYLLESSMLAPLDGFYRIKLSEPMEENAYLDAARLTVFDLPADWSMVLDERLATGGAPATGRPIYFRRSQLPAQVIDANGQDVTALATRKDRQAPPVGDVDKRFIGLLAQEQTLTLTFDKPLTGEGAVLVADGWIEYPYSQTVFAAWQAGLRYRAPTLEARAGDGTWQPLAVEFGYPAGMPRTMALPLPALPPGTSALRLSSNMEIYWDRLRLVWEEELPAAKVTTLKPSSARVARTGFAERSTGPQRLPHYDYQRRSPFWDAKVPAGFYTSFGDAQELVAETDGALAIIGSGEEVDLSFPASEVPANHRRYFAIRFHGWAKDMDLYTQDGHTVDPLPLPPDFGEDSPANRERLHARYNVRYEAGL